MSKQLTPKEYDAIRAALEAGTDRNTIAGRFKRSSETVVRIAKSRDWEDYHRVQRLATGRFLERADGTLVRRDQLGTYNPATIIRSRLRDAFDTEADDEPAVIGMLRQEQRDLNAHFEAVIAAIEGRRQ